MGWRSRLQPPRVRCAGSGLPRWPACGSWPGALRRAHITAGVPRGYLARTCGRPGYEPSRPAANVKPRPENGPAVSRMPSADEAEAFGLGEGQPVLLVDSRRRGGDGCQTAGAGGRRRSREGSCLAGVARFSALLEVPECPAFVDAQGLLTAVSGLCIRTWDHDHRQRSLRRSGCHGA